MLIFITLSTISIAKLLSSRTSTLNVSAVETMDNIEVYWDENCSQRVHSIDWGVLSPGETKEVVVYVQTEQNESFFLTPINWNPQNVFQYLSFSWNREDNEIEVANVSKVTQSLTVAPQIIGITDFSFDIIFETGKRFIGDINRDGVVDMDDVVIMCEAYGSTPEDPNWNPDADLNKDNVVDILDVVLMAEDYGKT